MPKNPNDRLSSHNRGYNHRWRQARAAYLDANPLCVECERLGRMVPASVVDHIEPHRGDLGKFWSRENWQALCKACHDGHKQRLEKSGAVVGCTADGMPLDSRHHWLREGG
jgi:5-methylcytosine-specific restriction endonuclease McrA